jgi:putative transposase
MAATRKVFKPDQIVNLLREIDVLTANGKTVPEACKAVAISDKSY